MGLSLVTAPAVPVVTLAEAKKHIRVDVSDEDDLIAGLIDAAREYVENFTHRALTTQTWDYAIDDFPYGYVIDLPKPPLLSVTSVSYIDQTGASATWAASGNYTVDAPAGPFARMGRVVPGYNVPYPVTRAVVNAVTIRFVAGYGSAASAVPASIKAAMKILIATWYDPARQAVNLDTRLEVIPYTVDALLWPFKAF